MMYHVWFNLCIYPTPLPWAVYDTRSIFRLSITSLNLKFSFSMTCCLSIAQPPSLPYYLPVIGESADGFMFFPRSLAPNETQTTLSKIWTLVLDFIWYDNKCYAECLLIWTFSSFIASYWWWWWWWWCISHVLHKHLPFANFLSCTFVFVIYIFL